MSDPLTSEELDAIEARALAATDGPWFTGNVYGTVDGCEILIADGCVGDTAASTLSAEEDAANAAHIVGLDPPIALRLVAMARASLPKTDAHTKSGHKVRDLEHRGWNGIIELPDGHVEHRWNADGKAAWNAVSLDLDLDGEASHD